MGKSIDGISIPAAPSLPEMNGPIAKEGKMKKKIIILVSAVLIIAAAIGIFIYIENGGLSRWKTSTPEKQGMDPAILTKMFLDIEESGKSINSITIIRNGYLVNDTYFYPYKKGLQHSLNSCTKSVISALTGIVQEEGQIDINRNVLGCFSDISIVNSDKRKQNMKIQDLLTMTTGFEWEMTDNISTNQMLQSPDWAKFTLDLPMKEEPGLNFNYCNGAAEVMSAILTKATNQYAGNIAVEKFKPLGIRDFAWNANGNINNGYSGLYMYPKDMAKFGYLYLKDGNWNGTQVISEAWVKESTTMHTKADWTPLLPGYGYMWWVTSFGGYTALGDGGNYIFVVPESNLVVVFTGGLFSTDDLFYPVELMNQYIIPSVKTNESTKFEPEAAESLKAELGRVQKAPAPEKVKPLPKIAAKLSGKPFVLEGSGVYTLFFKEGENEATLRQDFKYDFPVGLDGIFRITDASKVYGDSGVSYHRAIKGEWIDGDTFQIFDQSLEEGFETTYTFQFGNDQVLLTLKSNLGWEQTFSGKFPL